ncbi:MAG: hypothetical protein K2J90_06015 [Lachnospiraceae bacterium]|nr:hypothetical protein [Lachnospiraceae bacterium]
MDKAGENFIVYMDFMVFQRKLLIGIIMFVLLLSGCSKKNEIRTEPLQKTEIKEISALIKTKEYDAYEIKGVVNRNEKAFLLLEGYVKDEKEYIIYEMQGDIFNEMACLKAQEEAEITAFDAGADGTIYLLKSQYRDNESIDKLCILNEKGMAEKEISISAWLDKNDAIKTIQTGEEIYLFCESGKICVLNEAGERQYDITEHECENILEANRMQDGSVIFVSVRYSGDKENLNVYRIKEGKTTLVVKLEEELYGEDILVNGTGEYDFYLRSYKYISGYSMEEKNLVPVMRWEQNDFAFDTVGKISALSEDKWLALEKAVPYIPVYLEKENSDAIQQKQKLLLGCLYADSELQKQVAEFNKQNEEYYIEMVSYDEQEVPYQSFLADLAAGKECDIVVVHSSIEEMLVEKEMLEDLYPFIEKDGELSREDYLPNVLRAFERDGKLYQTVSRVNIAGWVTKKSYLEAGEYWNQKVFEQVLEAHPDAALFNDLSSREILNKFLEGMGGFPSDLWKESDDLYSREFYNMLDIAKKYGKVQGEILPEEVIRNLREEKLLFFDTVMNPFELELYDKALENDFAVVGFPFGKETGSTFWTDEIQCGIMTGSTCKEGAWQFVRTYLTREYQDLSRNVILFGMADNGIPVRKDCFEDFVKRFTATEVYEKDGEWIEPISGTVATDVFEYTVVPMDSRQERIFREIVTGTTQRRMINRQMKNIILEEAEAYFSGIKDMEQTVDIIQNRITTYINESR